MTNDRKGIYMCYSSSKDNPQSWYFSNLEDSRLSGVETNVTQVPDTVKIVTGGGDNQLITVTTTSNYRESEIIRNHKQCKALGYMMHVNDFKNVEMTCYAKYLNTNPSSYISMYARSGMHVVGRPCEGTKYEVRFYPNGVISGVAEHWHSGGYVEFNDNVAVLGNIENKRVGLKFICYNDPTNTAATIEGWADLDADNKWTRFYEHTEFGDGTDNKYSKCGDATTNVITWGGPLAVFRIFNVPINGIEIDSMSIREIDPHSAFVGPMVDPNQVDSWSRPTAPPSDEYFAGDATDDWDDDVNYPDVTWEDRKW